MAQDYIKILSELKQNFSVIGRGKRSASQCRNVTTCSVITGGLDNFLLTNPEICSHAIIAVGVEKLYEITKILLEYGVKRILVEKPGALRGQQFEELCNLSKKLQASVFVAYNRRFFVSVLEAQKIIEDDGGVTSFNFEFTEWSNVIKTLDKAEGVKENWFLSNSTHVVDLAFYLGGRPSKISTFVTGGLDWHPSGSIFSGAGITENGALFSYQANWESAGRWGVEILTKKHRLILRPMEKLQIQTRGSIAIEFADVDYGADTDFKPGLLLQTRKFLSDHYENMCSIEEQARMFTIYSDIANYGKNDEIH